jgi:hypothetical protein
MRMKSAAKISLLRIFRVSLLREREEERQSEEGIN